MDEMDSTIPKTIRGAQYVRMSTEHQQYSTHNQSDKILEYAQTRGIEIVKTYADEGKSGLSIGGRAALTQLIADVEAGNTDFTVILVYDISRWGRFQDTDESAYYEYICRRAGIQVAYCAEQFENDGSPTSTIVKSVKRAMAGEYSRELSAKVFAGQCRLIELGFRQGGAAGFGLRRVLVDQSGEIKSELSRGEHKSLTTDRVILRPGPDHEIKTVRQMYAWLIDEDMKFGEIATRLNDSGIATDWGREWNHNTVKQVLTNEKYIGNNVYNRQSFKLKQHHVVNPPDMWIRKESAFDGIVPLDTFMSAQQLITQRSRKPTEDEILEHLKNLYEDCGVLTGFLINEHPDLPAAHTIASRFGSLTAAYERVGFYTKRSLESIEADRRLRTLHPKIIQRTQDLMRESGAHIRRDEQSGLLHINEEMAISLVLARCQTNASGNFYWRIVFSPKRQVADLTVAIRLNPQNDAALDYYLLPQLDLANQEIRVNNKTCEAFECFRFDDLGVLHQMTGRRSVSRAKEV